MTSQKAFSRSSSTASPRGGVHRRDHEDERALAREKRLNALAANLAETWSRIGALIATRKPGEYDTAVALLKDLQAIAQRSGHTDEFNHRCTQLRQEHHRKPSLIQRLDSAGLTTGPATHRPATTS